MKKSTNEALIKTLRELRAWAVIEIQTAATDEARQAWRHVRDWSEGTAQQNGIETHLILTSPA